MTAPIKVDPPEGALGCADGCGRRAMDDEDAQDKSWTYLAISQRWRCPYCVRGLVDANKINGGTTDA